MGKDHAKVLGVMGGMGPLATQLFYKMIIDKTDAKCDQEHVDMIILNHATMPDRTKAIKENRVEELFQLLLKDAKLLEQEGATSIAIPCNTSHVLADRLQENLKVPLIHMVRETAGYISKKFDGKELKIGILATDGTIQMELYQKELEKAGITPVIPSEEMQKLVMKIIYDGVKNGGEIDFTDFLKIQEEIVSQNCQGAILACTELSCFKDVYKLPSYYIDAMGLLAEKSILSCGRKLKKTGV
ncbi:aspartate/glutamate racemase family protein [Sinanaerobacter chloroacetimidivorans]|uniref:Amino acid racemase n=1 Tax=Sinanaerobacter chloroacetimidivorans TaxID=2818044 RepID=A0A8J7W6M9_9FIRM|nr:amino acid racemase [Sinanaerobacter chloroacetimidivorans]MBR0600135.1 amino acid racemase [Sinanaerobacter chloroacetimidivorans]